MRTLDHPHNGRPSGAAVAVWAPVIVLLGPPGSGKSTQGARLAAARQCPWLSVGDLIRGCGRRLPRGPGGLANTQATVELIREALAHRDVGAGLVLDGFPRSADQVPAAIELFGRPPVCLLLQLDLSSALARMAQRGRPGEDPARQAQRYTEHAWRERALAAALLQHGATSAAVDAGGTPDTVAAAVTRALEALQPRGSRGGLDGTRAAIAR